MWVQIPNNHCTTVSHSKFCFYLSPVILHTVFYYFGFIKIYSKYKTQLSKHVCTIVLGKIPRNCQSFKGSGHWKELPAFDSFSGQLRLLNDFEFKFIGLVPLN